jgi:hypothetical protein
VDFRLQRHGNAWHGAVSLKNGRNNCAPIHLFLITNHQPSARRRIPTPSRR